MYTHIEIRRKYINNGNTKTCNDRGDNFNEKMKNEIINVKATKEGGRYSDLQALVVHARRVICSSM